MAQVIVHASTKAELASRANALKVKLKLDAARRMIVLLGGCDGRAVESIAFVSTRRIDELRELGIGDLADHLLMVRESLAKRGSSLDAQ